MVYKKNPLTGDWEDTDGATYWDELDKVTATAANSNGSTKALTGTSGKSSGSYQCYKSHPALEVGGGKVIYGGSCHTPAVHDADIYIGFSSGMLLGVSMPWDGKQEIYAAFPDMGIPENKDRFKKLIEWTSEQLDAGKKVHCGCMGGHGRTGTFLAALVAYRKHHADPIKYVRENYCKKAVESTKQVVYLNTHWGCPSAEPTKGDWGGSKHGGHRGGHGGGKAPHKPKKRRYEDGVDYLSSGGGLAPLNQGNLFSSGTIALRVKGTVWSAHVTPVNSKL